jgi:hypothetical protein
MSSTCNERSLADVLARLHGQPLSKLQLKFEALGGGLEATEVVQVTGRFEDARGRRSRLSLVVKHLRGSAVREASVYQRLVATHAESVSPRLLATEHRRADHIVLYLEALRPLRRWPWEDTSLAGQVLEHLAGLHTASVTSETRTALAQWDYDAELRSSAESTLEMLRRCCACGSPVQSFKRMLPSVRRIVHALPDIRRQLLAFLPFGSVAIHGDMHPGNVLVRRKSGVPEAVIMDWGRARMGSPLEDVSSWLRSLGYWEKEARRRHDTLLVHYLRTRGGESRLMPDFRAAYWLAGASNALSGALRHHLSVATDPGRSKGRRLRAIEYAGDWLRVLRRADSRWT